MFWNQPKLPPVNKKGDRLEPGKLSTHIGHTNSSKNFWAITTWTTDSQLKF